MVFYLPREARRYVEDRDLGAFAFGAAMAYQQYEIEKQKWLSENPGATPEQIEQAFKNIADKLGI